MGPGTQRARDFDERSFHRTDRVRSRRVSVQPWRFAALHVRNEYDVTRSVGALLDNPELLRMMRDKARAGARPQAADQIARHVLQRISAASAP
ncbi:MAG: hypothetical protein ACK2U9_08805 [Anaerolineae bacterium]